MKASGRSSSRPPTPPALRAPLRSWPPSKSKGRERRRAARRRLRPLHSPDRTTSLPADQPRGNGRDAPRSRACAAKGLDPFAPERPGNHLPGLPPERPWSELRLRRRPGRRPPPLARRLPDPSATLLDGQTHCPAVPTPPSPGGPGRDGARQSHWRHPALVTRGVPARPIRSPFETRLAERSRRENGDGRPHRPARDDRRITGAVRQRARQGRASRCSRIDDPASPIARPVAKPSPRDFGAGSQDGGIPQPSRRARRRPRTPEKVPMACSATTATAAWPMSRSRPNTPTSSACSTTSPLDRTFRPT